MGRSYQGYECEKISGSEESGKEVGGGRFAGRGRPKKRPNQSGKLIQAGGILKMEKQLLMCNEIAVPQ